VHFAAAPYVLGGIFIAMALAVFVFRVERWPATTEGAEAGPAQQSRIRPEIFAPEVYSTNWLTSVSTFCIQPIS